MKEKVGFIADGVKKCLAGNRWDAVGYLYRDGVVILERRPIKTQGMEVKHEFIHIFPCPLGIYISNYEDTYHKTFRGCIVVHNATLLIDGLKTVEVYYHNASESMKEKGIECITVTLNTQSGMRISIDQFPWMSSDLHLNNVSDSEKPMSIMYWEYKDSVVWHGEKPKKELPENDGVMIQLT